MMKVLFPFRFNNLKDIFNSPERNPKEFLYGMYELQRKNIYDIDFVFEPRGDKRGVLKFSLWLVEQVFARVVKLGMPFGIYWFHRKSYKAKDKIICINDAISFSVLFWKKVGLIDAEVITLFQSLPERYRQYFRHRKLYVWLIKKLLKSSNKILVLSSSAKNDISKIFEIELDMISVFYFGADLSYWRLKTYDFQNRDYILAIGNDMNRDYGTLCKALSKKYRIIVVSNRKIMCDDVEIKSGLSNDEVRDLYYGARLVITPSIKLVSESSGLSTTVQAMACGTPVMISDSLSMRELFTEEKEILYFEPENVDSLEKKLDYIWNDEVKLKAIAISARQKIEKTLNSENMAKQLEEVIG